MKPGGLLRQEFHRPGGPRGTGGHAEIDSIAEERIQKTLLAAFRWNYLGEELGHRDNGDPHFTWLVDPNDGTSAYLKGWRGSGQHCRLERRRAGARRGVRLRLP